MYRVATGEREKIDEKSCTGEVLANNYALMPQWYNYDRAATQGIGNNVLPCSVVKYECPTDEESSTVRDRSSRS